MKRSSIHPWRNVAAVLVALLMAGCGGADGARTDVLVSAAASLTDVFAEMEARFEAAHPDLDVVLNLAGSSTLREQILDGAPVDVFASADPGHMARVREAGAVDGEPVLFARNLLQIAVPPGNPGEVAGLRDLAGEALLVGLCIEGVPCGDLGRRALQRAGVEAAVDTFEPDVRALLTKVEAGELDAGIVYVTDVRAGGASVEGVEISPDHNVAAQYPIAVLVDAPNPTGAGAFVDLVLSGEGRQILADHGFGLP